MVWGRTFFASALLALALPAFADTVEYEAVWHDGDPVALFTGPQTLQAFFASGQELAEAGQFLTDIETTMIDGARVFSGMWRDQGGQFNQVEGPMGAVAFGNVWRERRAAGQRLEDFETWRSATGARRYIGVWRNGAGEERLSGPLAQEAFEARGTNFAENGLSLVDMEVYVLNGTVLYEGVFRTDLDGRMNRLSPPLSRADFTAFRDAEVASGRHLIDMETYNLDGDVLYVGVFEPGEGTSVVSALRPFPAFFVFAQDQMNAGRGPADFELRRLADDGGSPDGGGGGGPTTADLPPLPSWLRLTSNGNPNVIMDFIGPFPDPGFRLTIHRALLPAFLPTNAEGEIVMPDNFCGLRVHGPDRTFWETPEGTVATDLPYLDVDDYESTDFVQFHGAIGGCSGSNEAWQFLNPLTADSTGGPPPARRLVIELADEVEFLNFTLPGAEPLSPDELFSDDVFAQLVEIVELWNSVQEDNGYCDGVQGYMVEVCDANPGICPVPDPTFGC